MEKIMKLIRDLLSNPSFVLGGIVFISAFSLAAAYTAQYAFNLPPCILCLYQRVPFAVNILLGLGGLGGFFISGKHIWAQAAIILSGISFAANAVIAGYHTGVERLWWTSFLEGCKTDVSTARTPEDLLAQIQTATSVPCDEIPWADPVLGLSMANYNTLMCAGLAILCFAAACLVSAPARDN